MKSFVPVLIWLSALSKSELTNCQYQKSIHLFVAVEGLQPHNVHSKYGWIQRSELVDVYETLYKAGLRVC